MSGPWRHQQAVQPLSFAPKGCLCSGPSLLWWGRGGHPACEQHLSSGPCWSWPFQLGFLTWPWSCLVPAGLPGDLWIAAWSCLLLLVPLFLFESCGTEVLADDIAAWHSPFAAGWSSPKEQLAPAAPFAHYFNSWCGVGWPLEVSWLQLQMTPNESLDWAFHEKRWLCFKN